jgi:hypothetical protein
MSSRTIYTPADRDGDFDQGLNTKSPRLGQFFGFTNELFGNKFKMIIVLLAVVTCTTIIAFTFLLGLTIAVSELLPVIRQHNNNFCTSLQGVSNTGMAATLPTQSESGHHCGNSSEEARAADCIFDLSVAAWLPPSCFDAGLNAEFMALGPWDFYLSNSSEWDLRNAPANQRVLLPDVDAIADSNESMWTDRRYHIVHCAFSWKLMHKAVQRGQKTEETLHSYHHTQHCAQALVNTSVPVDAIITRVEISFPAC